MAAKTGTYSLINSTTLGSNQTTVTFSSIPQTFTDLVLVACYLSSIDGYGLTYRPNALSSGYSATYMTGNGSTATSGILTTGGLTYGLGYYNVGAKASGEFAISIVNFFSYKDSTAKTSLVRNGTASYGTEAIVNLLNTSDSITSLELKVGNGAANFVTGSTLKLYGIEAGNL